MFKGNIVTCNMVTNGPLKFGHINNVPVLIEFDSTNPHDWSRLSNVLTSQFHF